MIGDAGLTPLLGKYPGGGNGNSLQYSCPGNPMERGTWQAVVQGLQRVGHNCSDLAHMGTHGAID